MPKGRARILLVDDDKKTCATLSLILSTRGYDIDVADNGKEALEISKSKTYNLAVLDVKLPDVEGTKLLRTMQETSPETVRIMLTGYPDLQNKIDAFKNGASAYFIKPVDPARLIKMIEEKLEEQRDLKTSEKLVHASSKSPNQLKTSSRSKLFS